MKKIAQFFNKMMQSIKVKLIKPVVHFLQQKYYDKYVPWSKKFNHKMTHNFVIHFKGQDLYLFKWIKIHVSRKRREAFFGFLFIFIWIVGFLIFTFYPMIYSLYLSINTS